MGLTFFKNTVLLLVLTSFSCGSSFTENKPDNGSSLDNYIEIGKDIKEGERDITREEKKEAKTKTDSSMDKDQTASQSISSDRAILIGAAQPEIYIPMLVGKKVGIVANQTSVIIDKVLSADDKTKVIITHLVDFMVDNSVQIKKVFAPEHGFRGVADAGEHVKDGIDSKTGVPIISLYGNNKKPSQDQLKGIDVMVFDIQDVGARFYTYISTLNYVMEACAEAGIPLIILDRPNPNGHYIDGPIMEPENESFVGMNPVP